MLRCNNDVDVGGAFGFLDATAAGISVKAATSFLAGNLERTGFDHALDHLAVFGLVGMNGATRCVAFGQCVNAVTLDFMLTVLLHRMGHLRLLW